jgi:hypothetical protein
VITDKDGAIGRTIKAIANGVAIMNAMATGKDMEIAIGTIANPIITMHSRYTFHHPSTMLPCKLQVSI